MTMAKGVSICLALISYNLAVSSAILAGVNFLINIRDGNCEQILHVPIIWVTLALAVLSFICSRYSNVPFFLCANIFITLLIFFFSVCFFSFLTSVTDKGDGEVLPGKAYKEYRLADYSEWLQKRVNNTKRWSKINECLHRHHACKRMTGGGDWANTTLQQFYTKRLSSIESGCCKPSNDCNFSYVSPTNWTKTANLTYTNSDCRAWDDDPKILCFECQSCKAGVVDKYKYNLNKYPY